EACRGPVHLPGVQHAVAPPADIDESGLHAGQNVLHAPQIHVAHHLRRGRTGDELLHEHFVLEHSYLGDGAATVGRGLLAHLHDAVDGLAPRKELGLREDRRTPAARFASVTAPLALRLQPRRTADALDLVAARALAAGF